jgi:hypothetical protein
LLRFLRPYAKNNKAEVTGVLVDGANHDLTNFAVRFALCHAFFYQQLDGDPVQLAGLLEAVKSSASDAWAAEGISAATVGTFVDTAVAVVNDIASTPLSLDDEILPELRVARPLHPRYAPVDPLEPLPWEVENLERYQRKMARLVYTL